MEILCITLIEYSLASLQHINVKSDQLNFCILNIHSVVLIHVGNIGTSMRTERFNRNFVFQRVQNQNS